MMVYGRSSMSQVVKAALEAAIERKRLEMEELQEALRREEREEREEAQRKSTRRRKQTGIKPGSIPALAQDILKDAGGPMDAAALADALAQDGKGVTTRNLAAALKRYIEAGRYFKRMQDGRYEIIRE